jgi:hypothetical protein
MDQSTRNIPQPLLAAQALCIRLWCGLPAVWCAQNAKGRVEGSNPRGVGTQGGEGREI